MNEVTPEQVVEDFLAHRAAYDPVKAREYYLRTRKLVGRKIIDIKSDLASDKLRSEENQRKFREEVKSSEAAIDRIKTRKAKKAEREKRMFQAEQKLQRARVAASKLPPGKREQAEKKLNAAQAKLNKLKKNALFKGKSVLREAERTARSAGDTVSRTRSFDGTITSEKRRDRFLKQKPSQNRGRA